MGWFSGHLEPELGPPAAGWLSGHLNRRDWVTKSGPSELCAVVMSG